MEGFPALPATSFRVQGARNAVVSFDRLVCPALGNDLTRKIMEITADGYENIKGARHEEPLAGVGRNIILTPEEPVIIDDHNSVIEFRGKGAALDPARLDEEFDLLELRRKLGEKIARGPRCDYFPDADGLICVRQHVNEPLYSMFFEYAAREFEMYHQMRERNLPVDLAVALAKFEGIAAPRGQALGVLWTGVTSRGIRGDKFLLALIEHYEADIEKGSKDAVEDFREGVTAVCELWAIAVLGTHEAGFVHGNPQIGNFRMNTSVTICDLTDAMDTKSMPYPQKLAYRAQDLRHMIASAVRLDRSVFLREHAPRPLEIVLRRYFADNESAAENLLSFVRLREDGMTSLNDVFELAASNRKPLIEYRRNPLVSALLSQQEFLRPVH